MVEMMSPMFRRRYEEGFKEGMQQGIQQGIQQGMQQGIQQGIQRGKEEGKREALEEMLGVVLKLKFGIEGLKLLPELRKLPLEKLEIVLKVMPNVKNLDELRKFSQ